MESAKKYNGDYIKYGFTSIQRFSVALGDGVYLELRTNNLGYIYRDRDIFAP